MRDPNVTGGTRNFTKIILMTCFSGKKWDNGQMQKVKGHVNKNKETKILFYIVLGKR